MTFGGKLAATGGLLLYTAAVFAIPAYASDNAKVRRPMTLATLASATPGAALVLAGALVEIWSA